MAIIYPLSLPTVAGIAEIRLRAVNQTSMTMSPFTYKQQIFNHTGQRWEAEASLTPMNYVEAEQWIAFLLALRGRSGTFLMGDPNRPTARGSVGGTPAVNGVGQLGASLVIDGCTPNITGWIKAGDYFQLGSASTATLHKVLVDANTDALGGTELDFWPSIRSAPADDDLLATSNCVGRFRLNSGEQDWSISSATVYGITFAAVEAIT